MANKALTDYFKAIAFVFIYLWVCEDEGFLVFRMRSLIFKKGLVE